MTDITLTINGVEIEVGDIRVKTTPSDPREPLDVDEIRVEAEHAYASEQAINELVAALVAEVDG